MPRTRYESEAPEAPSKPTPAPVVEKLTPRAWAAKLGQIVKGNPRLPQSQSFPSQAHAVADLLHGWSKHEHHYQNAPLLLAREDYEAALKAGGSYPTTPAHEPALSPCKKVK